MFQPVTVALQNEQSLTREQMMFMLHYQNMIEAAYAFKDDSHLLSITASREFKQIFADLSFDEACDRFQTTILDACRLS